MKWPLICSWHTKETLHLWERHSFRKCCSIDKAQVRGVFIPVGGAAWILCSVPCLSAVTLPFQWNSGLEDSCSPYFRSTSFPANLEAVVSTVAAPQMRVLRSPASAEWNVCIRSREPWALPLPVSWPRWVTAWLVIPQGLVFYEARLLKHSLFAFVCSFWAWVKNASGPDIPIFKYRN